MTKLEVEIPDELEPEFKVIPKIELSLLISKLLKEKLKMVKKFERIISKSKLTEKDVKELSDKIDRSLAKRYDKLLVKR